MKEILPHRLDLLIAIAETGSLTAASERLGLTQPAASYRLSKLEESLGAPLFERTGRRLTLNASGRRALETAKLIAQEIGRLNIELSDLNAQNQARIRVGAHCFTTYRWLPAVMHRIRQYDCNLDVQIIAATIAPIKLLESRQVDLILSAYPETFPNCQSEFLFEDEIFALVSRDHRLAKRGVVHPADLEPETLLVYSAGGSPIIDEFMRPAGCAPKSVTEMPLTEGMFELARAGLGVATLAGWMLRRDNMQNMVPLRLGDAGFKRQWHGVFASDSDSPLLRTFIDELRQSILLE
ncbi:MAG: LysR family transcriptional regulator [Henriciella sp.]